MKLKRFEVRYYPSKTKDLIHKASADYKQRTVICTCWGFRRWLKCWHVRPFIKIMEAIEKRNINIGS